MNHQKILMQDNMWTAIIIIILGVAAVALGAFLFYQNQVQLQSSNQDNLIYPFTVQDGGPNGTTTLQCPSGREINIIDAWYELYDPNFQCTSTPVACSPAQDADGNLVFPSGCDVPSGIPTGDQPTSDWVKVGSGSDAAYMSLLCPYTNTGLPIDNDVPCISMNALGYLSNVANGQNSITISGSPDLDFGPAPCDNSGGADITGWPIGAPYNPKSPGENPQVQLGYSGYYGHGVYTCVLKD